MKRAAGAATLETFATGTARGAASVQLPASLGAIARAVLSPDGRVFAVTGRSGAALLPAGVTERRQSFGRHREGGGALDLALTGATDGGFAAAFSADSQQVAVSSAGRADVFSTVTGKQSAALPVQFIGTLAFTPDGRLLTGGEELLEWNVKSRRLLRHVPAVHEGRGRSLAFSKDGRRLYSTSDGALRTWDLGLGRSEAAAGLPPGAGGPGEPGRRVAARAHA